jgi:hypothetical protein
MQLMNQTKDNWTKAISMNFSMSHLFKLRKGTSIGAVAGVEKECTSFR